MPDWRNPANYHPLTNLPAKRWAWEFLRRNPDYQGDWKAALARFLAKTEEFEEWRHASWSQRFSAADESGRVVILCGIDDPEHPGFYLPVVEAEKWRLQGGLFNPLTDRPKYLGFKLDFGSVHFKQKGMSFESRGPAYPIVEFDLSLPLKPQLDTVYSLLKNEQKKVPEIFGFKPRQIKCHPEQWSHYLRLLDANLDKRTPKQIANALQEEVDGIDEKKVWDQLKAARKMIQPDGYMTIFLSPIAGDRRAR